MAEPFAALALSGAGPLINNYEKAWDPLKRKAQKMRPHRKGRDDRHDHELTPEERGLVLKKRSEVRSDEEIVEKVPRNQQMVPYKHRRGSSLAGDDYHDRHDERHGRNDRRVGAYRGGHHDAHSDSDSEASVPPRSRLSRTRSRRSSSRSRSESEDLGSSTDDERRCRKSNRKKWTTGAFATVATIHAGSKVYSSLEKRDKRREQLIRGEISPEEAEKKRNQGKWQDAAAVALAALGIRSAMKEWDEAGQNWKEYKEARAWREERHRRRMEYMAAEANRAGHRPRHREDRDRERDRDIDDGAYEQRAIKHDGEHDRRRSKSMSAYDDDPDGRTLVRNKSRRRTDE